MSTFRILPFLLLALLAPVQAQLGTVEEVQGTTDTPAPQTTKATLAVSPAYLEFPDDAGFDPGFTDAERALNLAARWDFEELPPNVAGPFKNQVAGGSLTASAVGAGAVSAVTVKDGVSRALDFGTGYVSGTTVTPLPATADGKFTVSMWFKAEPGEMDNKFVSLLRINNYFGVSSTNVWPAVVALYKDTTPAVDLTYLTIRGASAVPGTPEYENLFTAAGDMTTVTLPNNGSQTSASLFKYNFQVPNLDDGKWHHLVVTFNRAGTVTSNLGNPFGVFLDQMSSNARRTTIGTVAYTAGSHGFTNPSGGLEGKVIIFGAGWPIGTNNPHYRFGGRIDRVRIYGRILDEVERGYIHNQNADGSGEPPTGKKTDIVELNEGSNPLDHTDPGPTTIKKDDQGLSVIAGDAWDIRLRKALARWDFEQFTGAGNFPDLAGANDLTLNNVSIGEGMPSKGARFNGTADMKRDGLDWGAVNKYTLSYWIRFDSGGKFATTESNVALWDLTGVNGTQSTKLFFFVTRQRSGRELLSLTALTGTTGAGLTWDPKLTNVLSNGNWHHIALARGAGAYVLWIDGVAHGQADYATNSGYSWVQTFDNEQMSFTFGGLRGGIPGGYAGFEGNVDRLRVFNDILTDAEVGALYRQDYDGDGVSDLVEKSRGRDPLVTDPAAQADGTWDENGLPAFPATAAQQRVLAHWNFESFKYRSSGSYFENMAHKALTSPGQGQVSGELYGLVPDEGVSLGTENVLAGNYAQFREAGSMEAPLSNILASKDYWGLGGWLKVEQDSIWEANGIPVPLWNLQDVTTGNADFRLYAMRLGEFTQIFYVQYDAVNGNNVPVTATTANGVRWILPRTVRLDDEGWHHVMFRKTPTAISLVLDGKALNGQSLGGAGGLVNFSGSNAVLTLGKTFFKIGTNPAIDYHLKGGWDRLRLYGNTGVTAIPTNDEIQALYNQDADGDLDPDIREYGVPGRSSTLGDAGDDPLPEYSADLALVDLQGVPPALNKGGGFLGLWDFENFNNRVEGFANKSPGALGAMVPMGTPVQSGQDPGTGMPSLSAYVRDGGYLSAKANQFAGRKEFSTSMWIRTEPGLLDREDRDEQHLKGVCLISLEDLQRPADSNTLVLRLEKKGLSQSLIVQSLATLNGFVAPTQLGAAWSLVDKRLDDGGWHHVAWVRTEFGSKLFVDGALLTERNVPETAERVLNLDVTQAPGAAPRIVLGRASARALGYEFTGNFDRVRAYGKALTNAEVASLYKQDFDGDGFSDFYESGRFGFDPFAKPVDNSQDPGATEEDWDDDTGLTDAEAMRAQLVGSWGFERSAGSEIGDSGSSIRFPAQYPASAGSAVAEGGVQWNLSDGLLSRSVIMGRNGFLSFPGEIFDSGSPHITSSFWVRMGVDEIASQAMEIEGTTAMATKDKIALVTFGTNQKKIPHFVASVNGAYELVVETFGYQGGTETVTRAPLVKWRLPAKLDDGRWHHVVLSLSASNSLFVDASPAVLIGASTPFPAVSPFGGTTDPYLWIGFRENKLLDQANTVVSALPYRGFEGAIDRVRFYTKPFTSTLAGNLYFQDRDTDTISDVTEANSFLDPYKKEIPLNEAADHDGDGLSKTDEATLGTEWRKPDSDGDWTQDGWENRYFSGDNSFQNGRNDTGERAQDRDSDGLDGWQEFLFNTDPNDADTDDDSYQDGAEIRSGSDPTVLASVPGTVTEHPGVDVDFLGALPGGTFSPSAPPGGVPSYSYSGADATGPRYRKLALNGRPLADESPEAEGETDGHKEETYVDAYSLGLHYDHSLIYVPLGSSELALHASLSLTEKSWSDHSGLRPQEEFTSPFGPCWSSNLCAYVEEVKKFGELGTDVPVTYSAIDEDGRPLKFGSYDGVSIFSCPSSLTDRKSYQHELRRKSGSTLVMKKKFGTKLTYELTDLVQDHLTNRAGPSSSRLSHRYYRLVLVEDRFGNQLRYGYPAHKATLIPNVIYDPKRIGQRIKIEVESLDNKPQRIKSITDPRGYTHQFGYLPVTVPSGGVTGTASIDTLASIIDPMRNVASYTYEAVHEAEVSGTGDITRYYAMNVRTFTDKRSVTTEIAYEKDDDKYYSSVGAESAAVKRIYGLPRLVKRVTLAAAAPAGLPGASDVSATAEFSRRQGMSWIYGPQGVRITSGGPAGTPSTSWYNEIRDAEQKTTTYVFRGVEAGLVDTSLHGSSFSLNWMVYYLQMDIVHPDGIGTEVYKFDLSSGLSVKEVTDICNNRTLFRYNDAWGGISIAPSNMRNLALFSRWGDPTEKIDALNRKENYTFSPNFRVMSSSKDVHNTLTAYEVDRLGRRTAMTVTDSAGTVLAKQRYEFRDDRFPSFMTKRVIENFNSLTGQPWENDLITLYFADNYGRMLREVLDMNRNGLVDDTPDPVTQIRPDLITQYDYDKNGNRTAVTDPRFYRTDFIYDPMNRLCRTVYPAADGPARTLRAEELTLYDAGGNVSATIDGNGDFVISKHDALDRLRLEIRDMDGGHNPNRSAQTNIENEIYYVALSDGSYGSADLVTEYSYNKVDSKTLEKNPRGFVTKTVYDAVQRPVQVWENYVAGDTETEFAGSGSKRLTLYSYLGNCGSSVFSSDAFKPTKTTKKNAVLMASGEARDVVSSSEYDAVYRLVSDAIEYEPLKVTRSTIEYDDASRRETKKIASEETYESLTMTQFDGLRRVVATVTDVGGSDPTTANSTTTTLYSSTGLAFRITDPANRETETDYDASGRAVKVWQPRIDLPPGHADFGKVERVVGLGSESQGSPVTETIYDEAGNVKITRSPRGHETKHNYDARNRKVLTQLPAVDADGNRLTFGTIIPESEVFYDAAGRTVTVSDYRGNMTRSFYDKAGRVRFTRVNPVDGQEPSTSDSPAGSGPNDIVTEKAYDKVGNIIFVRDGNGSYTRNSYDGLNRLVATAMDPLDGDPVDPNAGNFNAALYQGSVANSDLVVTNVVDDAGNIVEVTDGKNQKTAFRFDGKGRKTRVVWDPGKPLSRTEEYIYDGVVLTKRRNADLTVVDYSYDKLLRLTAVTYPGRPEDDRIQGHDRAGNLLSVSYNGVGGNPAVRNVSQSFDALSRLLSETSNGKTHSHTYDKSGNRKTTTYGGTSRHIISTYDDLERLVKLEERDSPLPGSGRITWYGYDNSNNILTRELPNGVSTLTTYDDLNRRLEIVDKIPGANGTPDEIISSFTYGPSGYDKASNVLRILEGYSLAGVKPREVVNTYDKANRLLTETSTATSEIISTTYGYDKGNNRTRRIVTGPVSEDLTYSYGDGTTGSSNQLMSFASTVTGVPIKSYSYDHNGNRTGVAHSSRADIYKYDRDHRLIEVSFQTTSIAGNRGMYRYVYDHRTRRVQKYWDLDDMGPAPSVVTDLSFCGGTSVQEWTGLTITRQYVRGSDFGGGIGGILYSMGGTATDSKFSHYNSRGDVVGQTNNGADATWQASYEAFGTRVDEGGDTPEQPQRASTKEEDPTGLLNEGMRYRDLETGSFITRDPAGFIDGPNVYTYVNQNPWTKVDPDGLFWSLIVTAVTAAVDTYQVSTGQISKTEYAGRMALNAVAAVADIATGGMGGGMAVRVAATAARAGKVGVAALKTAVIVDKAEMAVTTAQAAISAKDAIQDGDYARAALSAAQVGLSVHGAKKDIQDLAPNQRSMEWSPTHSQNRPHRGPGEESHHIVQDKAAINIRGYQPGGAPARNLYGGKSVKGSPHDSANKMQDAVPRGLRGNYGNERYVAYLSLRAAGQSRGTARYDVNRADLYFKGHLGLTNKSRTRIPGRGQN